MSGPMVNSGCEWTKFIYLTQADVNVVSDQLARQVLAHNETRKAICGN